MGMSRQDVSRLAPGYRELLILTHPAQLQPGGRLEDGREIHFAFDEAGRLNFLATGDSNLTLIDGIRVGMALDTLGGKLHLSNDECTKDQGVFLVGYAYMLRVLPDVWACINFEQYEKEKGNARIKCFEYRLRKP